MVAPLVVPAKPPPTTEAVDYAPFEVEKTEERDVRLNISILDDTFLGTRGKKAKTNAPALPRRSYTVKVSPSPKKILSYTFVWKGTMSIRTTYPKNFQSTDRSAYGRGTQGDLQTGNVSLGFHEACHRNDYLAYLGKSQVVAGGQTPEPYGLPDTEPPVTIDWD